jgi:hypothetical protein
VRKREVINENRNDDPEAGYVPKGLVNHEGPRDLPPVPRFVDPFRVGQRLAHRLERGDDADIFAV